MSLVVNTALLDKMLDLIANVEAHRGELSYQCEIRLAWSQVVECAMTLTAPPPQPDYDSLPYPTLIGYERVHETYLAENKRVRAKLTDRRVVAAWDAYVANGETSARDAMAAIEAELIKRGVRQPAAA